MILSRKKKILYMISLVATGIIVHEFYKRGEFGVLYAPSKNKRGHSPLHDDVESFISDWCRLQRSRVDWEELLGTCRNKMAWKHREKDSEFRTDPDRSFISRWDIGKQGEFSRFFVQSITSNGRTKKTGGDSWRVYIRQGPASLAPTVFDNDDGTYEVLFLALEPGNYSVQVFLDYTLCDGFRDPPEDWFIRGNVQGRGQKHGMLGYIGDDYLKAPLQRGKPAEFHVRKSDGTTGYFKYIQPLVNASQTSRKHLSKLACGIDCSLVWNGFGRWVNRKWMPYLPEENENLHQNKETNLETLLVYGDSIALHYHALANTLPLCGQVFRRCDKKYMWIYDADWKGRDTNDFNQSIVVEEIKQALTRPDMRGPNSLFLLNIGIHYSISLNLTTYQKLINSVIAMIKQGNGDKDGETTPRITQAMSIWRSSTAIEREYAGKYYGGDNLTDWRFHTSPRVQLFHRYATGEMCKAGIPVLDMYPITAAWPHGTVRHDHIHYPSKVMEPAVTILERYLSDRQHT